jgi:E3 ubiquitin-protein ligase HUWE1
MYRGIGFAHAKVATGFLQILNTPEETAILEDLGKLHRACVWENILIKSALPQAVVAIDGGTTGGGPSVARGQMQTVAGVPDDILEDINNGLPDPTKNGDGPAAGDSVQTRNGKAFKYLVSQLPASLTPFSQGSSAHLR